MMVRNGAPFKNWALAGCDRTCTAQARRWGPGATRSTTAPFNITQYCNGTTWVNRGVVLGVGTLTSTDFCTTDGTNVICNTPFTGTGSVVLSISPALTGTRAGVAANFSGNVGIGLV
jgi:hypothetical protein